MVKKSVLFFLLIPFALIGFEGNLESQIKQGRELIKTKNYKEAVKVFENFGVLAKSEVQDQRDEILYQHTLKTVGWLKGLVDFVPIEEEIKNARKLEAEKNYEEAKLIYLKLKEDTLQNQIDLSPYFKILSEGRLEELLVLKINQGFDRLEESFLKDLKQDKKRKKSIIVSFSKESDFEDLLSQFKTGFEKSAAFIFIQEEWKENPKEKIKKAAEKNINLIIMDFYDIEKNQLEITFFDPFNNKKLVTIRFNGDLIKNENQKIIEAIIQKIEIQYQSFSSLEENDSFVWTFQSDGVLQEEKQESPKEEFSDPNWRAYLDRKIYDNEYLMIDSLLNPEDLDSFLNAFAEMEEFNKTHFLKIPIEDYQEKYKEILRELLISTTDIQEYLMMMEVALKDGNTEDYLNNYDLAKDSLKDLLENYPPLAYIIQDMEKEIDREHDAIEKKLEEQNFYDKSFCFYLGAVYVQQRTYEFLNNQKFDKNIGGSLLFGIPLNDSTHWIDLYFDLKANAFFFKKSLSYAIQSMNMVYYQVDYQIAGDFLLGFEARLKNILGISLFGGTNYTNLKSSSPLLSGYDSKINAIGWKAGAGVSLDFLFIRLEAVYEMGKTEKLNHKGLSFYAYLKLGGY